MTTPASRGHVAGDILTTKAVHTPGGVTSTEYVTRIARHIGAVCSAPGRCPSSTTDWLGVGTDTLGPLETNKQFYGGAQSMSTFAKGHNPRDQEAMLPPDIWPIIVYDQGQVNQIVGYINSIPPEAGNFIVVFSQEPEGAGKWPNAKAFTDAFKREADKVHALNNPRITFASDSSTSAYTKGGKGWDGSWITPIIPYSDLLLCDCYQNHGSQVGLERLAKFQQWAHYALPAGKPWGFGEYGLDASVGDSARHDNLARDALYLASGKVPGAEYFEYWWSDCQAGVLQTDPGLVHQFHDAPTIALFKSFVAGTF